MIKKSLSLALLIFAGIMYNVSHAMTASEAQSAVLHAAIATCNPTQVASCLASAQLGNAELKQAAQYAKQLAKQKENHARITDLVAITRHIDTTRKKKCEDAITTFLQDCNTVLIGLKRIFYANASYTRIFPPTQLMRDIVADFRYSHSKITVAALRTQCRKTPDCINERALGESTPLMIASIFENVNATESLLQAKAEPNFVNNEGFSPLHFLMFNITPFDGSEFSMKLKSEKNILHAYRLLVEHGARVNAQTHEGHTPLMIAALGLYDKPVKMLIEDGADVTLTDKDGYTALDIAQAAQTCAFMSTFYSCYAGINLKESRSKIIEHLQNHQEIYRQAQARQAAQKTLEEALKKARTQRRAKSGSPVENKGAVHDAQKTSPKLSPKISPRDDKTKKTESAITSLEYFEKNGEIHRLLDEADNAGNKREALGYARQALAKLHAFKAEIKRRYLDHRVNNKAQFRTERANLEDYCNEIIKDLSQ